MRHCLINCLVLCATVFSSTTSLAQKVFTSDIDNFWIAYDSIQSTSDSLEQIRLIRTLYIDKGTPGLHAFMEARNYTAAGWVASIRSSPAFWKSIRHNTLSVKTKANEIEQILKKFKELYPRMKPVDMYFTIGVLRSGGTVAKNMVLVGAEIAAADEATVVSDLNNPWLAGVFKEQKPENLVYLNTHEYVHAQQRGEPVNVLGASIHEGACDFIAEIVMGKPITTNYINYGKKHEAGIKEKFREQMFTTDYANWLYNGGRATEIADLGYFMGYVVCKSFYEKADKKKKAIRQIIELNYSDTAAVENFLKSSGYFKEPVNKRELVTAWESQRPAVVKLAPFHNGDTLVDPSLKEMQIIFSGPMLPKRYSFENTERGGSYSPISGIVGFGEDHKTFTIQLKLEPGKEYEFVVTGNNFRSSEGYPAKKHVIKFKTKGSDPQPR